MLKAYVNVHEVSAVHIMYMPTHIWSTCDASYPITSVIVCCSVHIYLQLELHPVYLKRPSGAPPDPPGHGHTQGTQPRYDLELLCNGVVSGRCPGLKSRMGAWCCKNTRGFVGADWPAYLVEQSYGSTHGP